MNLREFDYREETVSLKEIFPGLIDINSNNFYQNFRERSNFDDRHAEILNNTKQLWNYGYKQILDRFGFHEPGYEKFAEHCHQITPALGAVLLVNGFNVAYLEAYRADPATGEKIDPKEEKSEMREEFCGIGRIPYCCLEVDINGEKYYISGKHLKEINGATKALLTPDCYRDMVGVFPHQNDPSKSGIYLAQTMDFPGVENGKPFVWKKQKMNMRTGKPAEPEEFFKTFAHMRLTF